MSEGIARENRRESIFRWSLGGILLGGTLLWMVFSIFTEPKRPDNFTNSHSYSPGGHRALTELLERQGREVVRNTAKLKAPKMDGYNGDTLLLLEPIPEYVYDFADDFELLFDEATRNPTSIILVMPKRWYRVSETQDNEDSLELIERLHPKSASEVPLREAGYRNNVALLRVNPQSIHAMSNQGYPIENTRTSIDAPVQVFSVRPEGRRGFEVLAETENGHPVVLRVRDTDENDRGGVILVSDPDVFSNRYIARDGAAQFVMAVIEKGPSGKIIIDEQLHGFSTDSSVEYLAVTPPGLYVTLSVLLMLLVFAWRQATVVRPARLEQTDRTDRTYAIEGVARMMLRTRDHRGAASRIGRRSYLVLGQGAAQVGGPGSGSGTGVRTRTGRLSIDGGENQLERLMTVAQRVAMLKRTGGTEHGGEEENANPPAA